MAGFESEESLPDGHTKHVSDNEQEFRLYATATYALFMVMVLGTVVSCLLQHTGVIHLFRCAGDGGCGAQRHGVYAL